MAKESTVSRRPGRRDGGVVVDYDTAKANLDKAQKKLKAWDDTLNDPGKFQPIMKMEWESAFDAREDAVQLACKADPDRFVVDYPSWAWMAVYLGLKEAA